MRRQRNVSDTQPRNRSRIRRLIEGATQPGDLVLDPTCGSGTTLVAAQATLRRSIGFDISADAVALSLSRLRAGIPSQMELFA